MYAVRAEWKKFFTFREVHVGLALAVGILLWGILPMAQTIFGLSRGSLPMRDQSGMFWVGIYNFNFNVASILILFLQVAGLSRLFCCEWDGQTGCLLRTSRSGIRSTFKGKVLLGLGYSVVTSLLPGILAFLFYAVLYGGVPTPFERGQSASWLGVSGIPLWDGAIPLGLWAWEMLFSLLGGLCAAGLVMLVSALFRRPAAAMAVSAVCLALPAVLRVGVVRFNSLFTIPLLNPVIYFLSILGGISWHSILTYDHQLLGEEGAFLWRPILYCLCLLGVELALAWAAWNRRARR